MEDASTPDLGFGDFGQEFHQGAFDVVGAESQSRNPGGGFGIGTEWVNSGKVFGGVSWDAALTINGTAVPEPSTLAMFGLLAVFAAPRRRR